VLDPLFGYLLATESTIDGNNLRAVNFGPTSDSLSVKTVSELAKSTWGEGASLEIERTKDNFEAKTLELDSSYAQQVLEWSPKWSQEKAVIDSIKWWKDVLKNDLTYEEVVNRDLDFLFESKIR
jgi:CDP-glucose 4,6-dehydratase